MDTIPVQFALREIRGLLASSKTQGMLAVLILLLAFSGPFGTTELMPFAPRLIYWAVIVLLTFCSGMLVAFLNNKPRPWWRSAVMNGVANGVMVSLILLTVNAVAMRDIDFDLAYVLEMLSYSFGVSVLVFALLGMFHFPDLHKEKPEYPTILKRLELNKRGALVSMTVRDHYVEVTTTQGTGLLLMRLVDAMAETAPTKGLQIHRSHWVALNQIENVRRQGDRAIVALKNGTELPASRSNLKMLKDTGLLP